MLTRITQLAQEEETDDDIDVTWGASSSSFFVGIACVTNPWKHIFYIIEDQQRINSFSKLNARVKSIEERSEELKVRAVLGIVYGTAAHRLIEWGAMYW